MDLNTVRSLVTLFSFGLFITLLVWTCRPARRQALHEAAMLPFDGESESADTPPRGAR